MSNASSQILLFLNKVALGRERAITVPEIATIFDIDERSVRGIIYKLRNEQLEPIGSCSNGCFIAVTDEEKQRFVSGLYRRAFKQLKTARIMERRFSFLDPDGRQQILDLMTAVDG